MSYKFMVKIILYLSVGHKNSTEIIHEPIKTKDDKGTGNFLINPHYQSKEAVNTRTSKLRFLINYSRIKFIKHSGPKGAIFYEDFSNFFH